MLRSRCRSVLHRYVVCLGLALASYPQVSPALTFGPESVESYLGQPLRVSFRLRGAPAELEPSCLRLLEANSTDGIASISQGNLKLERRGGETFAVLTTTRSINEPVLRITLSNNCGSSSRRDYLLLLDLPPEPRSSLASAPSAPSPPVEPPAPTASVTTGSSPSGVDIPRAATEARASAPQQGSRPSTREPSSRRSRPQGSVPASKGIAGAASTARSATPVPPRREAQDRLRITSVNPSTRIDDASLAALAVPRLRLSAELLTDLARSGQESTATQDALQKAIADERRARLRNTPIEEDLAPRLEADLIVARRKLEELQAQIQQAPSMPATAPPAAKSSVGQASPSGAWWDGWSSGWSLWGLLVATLALLLAALFWIRRRQQSQTAFEAAAADLPLAESGFETSFRKPDDTTGQALPQAVLDEPSEQQRAPEPDSPTFKDTSVSPATTETVETSRPLASRMELAPADSPALTSVSSSSVKDTHYSANANDVDVQELSQVTEEAQVYVEVGRTDQAISLLKQHVESHSGQRPSPAPWLMLLDLYRKTGNREAYDQLAPEFQRLFNGRMPSWDNYGHELALDDGLEAFPHLVARISRDWHTLRARELLEELLYDNRGGSRLGFSLAAYRDILLLMQIHDMVMADGIHDRETSLALDPDDGTPKWTLELDTVDESSSNLDKWLGQSKDAHPKR